MTVVTQTLQVASPEFPSVVLTPTAFNFARASEVDNIRPNVEVMSGIVRSVGELVGKTELAVPTLTVINAYNVRIADTNFATAPDETMFIPASELGRSPGLRVEHYLAGTLRQGLRGRSAGVIDVSVKDWNDLGTAFVAAMLRTAGNPEVSYMAHPNQQIFDLFRGDLPTEDPTERILREAVVMTPYTVSRRTSR